MNADSKLKTIFLAFLGVFFIVAYFWFFAHSKIVQLIQLHVPKNEIIAQAEQAFKDSPLGKYALDREIGVGVDNDLTYYVQTHLKNDSAKAFLPLGEWRVEWKGKIEAEQEKKQQARFGVRYDFDGNLIGLEQELPTKTKLPGLSEPLALSKAKSFLVAHQVDTAAITLTEKRTSQEQELLKYEFVFTAPSSFAEIKQKYEVEISASAVTRYNAEVELDKEKSKKTKFEEISYIVAISFTFVAWIAASIVLLVAFFKRLRHDELEFKRAIWLGVAACIISFALVGIEAWPEWAGVFIGGGFSGLFIGAGMLIAFAVAESLAREVWPEKVATTDVLLRGFIRVRETGKAILTAFFIAGLTLFLFGGLIWLAGKLDFAYFEIDDDRLWMLRDQFAAISRVGWNLIIASFVWLLLFSFSASYLRSKIRNRAIFVVALGLLYNFSGLHFHFFKPTYLAFALILPIAMLWADFAYEQDFFTIFLSLIAFYHFLNLGLLVILPNGLFSAPAIATGVLGVMVFIIGLFLIQSRKAVKDIGDYIPEYVSRIAERERFLKELEIARSVQMRLLPQSNPSFPQLEVASICRPAMEVGGDYYDFIRDGDQSLSIVIGDVSGKGISAAFYMTMVKGIIKTLSRKIQSPKLLLSELNEIFYEISPKERFISAIYGRFDMQNKTLTFARAGHNPLIARKRIGAESELLHPKGIAIGLEKGKIFASTIEEKILSIEPGDLFIFYTDGISESMNKAGEEFGEERLSKLIGQGVYESAQALLDAIVEEVNKFVGNANQHDDFTLVVVRVQS